MWVWVVPSDMSYCLTWCGRSDACAMTRGEVIRHPGGVAAVRSPVFRHAGCRRHAGTVRRASHQSHPGGGAGLSRPPWHVSCCVSMLCVAITACHHLRGGILGRPSAVPACRRHPGRRNTGLRTAPTAYRGWKLPRLWSASPLWRSSSDGIPSRVVLLQYDLLQKVCPAPRGGRAPRYILSEAVTSLPLIGFLFRF